MTERPVPVRDLRLLPKADLHLHLEGSARLETMLDLADRYGVSLTREHLRTFADFSEFEARYVLAVGLIRTPADLERICRELVQDAARQGVGYLEPMVGPFTYCDVFGWPADAIFDLMTGCFSAEGRAQGVDIGIMVGLIRGWDDNLIESTAEFAAAHAGKGVVALGIAGGGESPTSQEKFARHADEARAAGLKIVPHAGELDGASSVRAALHTLKPDRIAHGIRAVEDESVLLELAQAGIPCDVSIQSNVALQLTESPARHPLPKLLAAGVQVTLGSDDQLLFGDGVLAEYEIARRDLGLTDHQLAAIALTSYRSCGLPKAEISKAELRIEEWLRN